MSKGVSRTPQPSLAKQIVDGMRPKDPLDPYRLTPEILWRIMETCAAPKVAKAIRRMR